MKSDPSACVFEALSTPAKSQNVILKFKSIKFLVDFALNAVEVITGSSISTDSTDSAFDAVKVNYCLKSSFIAFTAKMTSC